MPKRPNLKDVAVMAGVSTTTVSHVINQTRYVDPATEARVQQAIKELRYVNNSWAKMLKSDQSDIIGLLVTDLRNPYEVHITNYTLQLIRSSGYQLHIAPMSARDRDTNQRAIQSLLSYRVAGVVSVPFMREQLAVFHEALNVPMVCIEGFSDMTDTVDTDHREATRKTIRLMADTHQKIGFIVGENHFLTSQLRLQGYQQALSESGLTFDPNYVANGHSTVEGGYAAAKELLKTDITALFAANNSMMQGTLQAINETDPGLYDRIALVGFDDQDWYPLFRPSITAIRQPLYEIVKKAVDLLMLRMQEPNRPLEQFIIPSELMRRDSF